MGSVDLDEAVLGQLAADLGEAVAADLVLAFVEEMRGRREPLREAAHAGRLDVLGLQALSRVRGRSHEQHDDENGRRPIATHTSSSHGFRERKD